ncbi:TetR family transcriptional regulator [Actinocatenispora thailandica]|uniref:TetR family transcriptional regulator n=1 Tax=Actinocatenispora thailandica TaxID=227318 RepID=A0A7R7DKM4_9ACTN|nr:TetR/AcrR family transcriptional regulator [Actinocatenispora thailandica]BCJ33494.1 TetR family transcriptional regulator [Actinocatenispora thailandica]
MTGEDGTPRRGRPPVSDRQRQRQRLAISRHAVRLFAAQGVAATTGEQIARAAGISERTLWRHFRTKDSCAEPLLTTMVDAFQAAVRAWPAEIALAEHLRATYTPMLGSAPATDLDAVLQVVRMTGQEPALRATYLMLRERAETTLAEVLADRLGEPVDSLGVQVRAAALSAVLRVATDRLAGAAGAGLTHAVLDEHREQLADAIGRITDQPDG